MTPGDRIHADAVPGILDRKTAGRGDEAALGDRSKDRREPLVGFFGKGRRHLKDMPSTLALHRRYRMLGDVEEPVEIGAEHPLVIVRRIAGERTTDEDPCIVDERVNATEAR